MWFANWSTSKACGRVLEGRAFLQLSEEINGRAIYDLSERFRQLRTLKRLKLLDVVSLTINA